MSVRIVYQDIAAGAEEDALITAPGAADFTAPAMLPFGGSDAPIATLEPFSWLLDGSRELLDHQPLAYWSEAMSGPDGRFEAPPEIRIAFDQRYTSPGLFLTFDTAAGDYCSHVTAEWYRGENLLKKKDFFPDGPEYFCRQTVEAWDGIVLRLNATSLPYRYAKLRRIVFGVARTFLRQELRNVHVTQEASIISSEVAVNTLDFTLDSRADVEYMFQMKQPVSAYDGDRLIGVFYIDDSKHRAKGLYDVSCKDAVGVLDDDPYPARMLNGEPAGTLLEDILGGHFRLWRRRPLPGTCRRAPGGRPCSRFRLPSAQWWTPAARTPSGSTKTRRTSPESCRPVAFTPAAAWIPPLSLRRSR